MATAEDRGGGDGRPIPLAELWRLTGLTVGGLPAHPQGLVIEVEGRPDRLVWFSDGEVRAFPPPMLIIEVL